MRAVLALLALPLHAGLILLAAALLPGLLGTVGAMLVGEAPPHPLQDLRDQWRSLRRPPTREENAAPAIAAAPVASLVAAAAAALLVPSFALFMPLWPLDDLLLVGGLLALSRLAPALAALDGGGALPGLGASRAQTAAALAFPALLLVLLALAAVAGSTNIDVVAGGTGEGAGLRAPLGLALAAAALLGLAGEAGEAAGRAPLSATGGAMLLALSGRDLAFARAAASLRLATGVTLLGTLFLPLGMATAAGDSAWPLDWLLGVLCWAGRLLAGGVLLALARAAGPRLRPVGLLGVATLLGLLAAVLLFLAQSLA